MNSEHEKYIRRCIELAKNGIGQVSPNPLVGAVIVHEGKIIGEGYHIHYGQAHAEVNAINSVKNPELLKESTIYVSLEPCSHHGKTPPCADLIIQKQIPFVVVGCIDPFSKVAGRGINKLKEAGIEVITGILEKECQDLIKKFITFHTYKRPYIILKWAESADGYIDQQREGGKPFIFSTPLTAMLTHKRRAEADGIMIGKKTALLDNPSLTVRNWVGKNPTRIVLDRNLSLPTSLEVFNKSVQSLFCTDQQEQQKRIGYEYIQIDYTKEVLSQILSELYHHNIQSLLVEGGSQLLQSFIDLGYWDEAFIEKAPAILTNGIKAPLIHQASKFKEEEYFSRRIFHWKK